MPTDEENILSLERFESMLSSVSCTGQEMILEFEDTDSFKHAARIWDWVRADNHSFVLVDGKGHCGIYHRVPYLISTIRHDEEHNTARLSYTIKPWAEVVRVSHFHFATTSKPTGFDMVKRGDHDTDKDIDMNHQLVEPFSKVGIEHDGKSLKVACEPCKTEGTVRLEISVHTHFGDIESGFIRMTNQGLIAHTGLSVVAANTMGKEIKKEWLLTSINLLGWKIPGIYDVGPALEFKLGMSLKFEGRAELELGGTVRFPEDAMIEVDLNDLNNFKKNSWDATMTDEYVRPKGQVVAVARAYLEPALVIKAGIFSENETLSHHAKHRD